MAQPVSQLYPEHKTDLPLEGLYLAHDLQGAAQEAGRTLVFSNYVTSLDGRIAVPHPSKPGLQVPPQIANDRDWRLFQELAVQSDVLITSGRYLRDYAEGRAQEILSVYDKPDFADLKEWRTTRGLPPYPALAVVSNSLDFSVPEVLVDAGREVLVFTSAGADPQRVAALQVQTNGVLVTGESGVEGRALVEALGERGHRVVFNTTGPQVLHMLASAGVLDRLYLTFANKLLGGSPFATVLEGELLDPAVGFRLSSLYFDAHGLDGLGQLFARYDVASPA